MNDALRPVQQLFSYRAMNGDNKSCCFFNVTQLIGKMNYAVSGFEPGQLLSTLVHTNPVSNQSPLTFVITE